jgi:hypothetical protein
MPIMKTILITIFAAVLSISVAHADTVYLKDGSLMRGTITNETDETIVIEAEDSWKKIERSDIERINRDKTLSEEDVEQIPEKEQDVNEEVAVPPEPEQQALWEGPATNVDMRLRFGIASGADETQFTSLRTLSSDSDRRGRAVQADVVISPWQALKFGPVFSAGVFRRRHSGSGTDDVDRTSVDYDATGVCLAGGLRIKASERFHFEAKVEVGMGQGKAQLRSPTVVWNRTDGGRYTSAAIMAGWYYVFNRPGLQLGLEVGGQRFTGEFDIWHNAGYWVRGKVKGDGGMAHVVLGYRF